MKKRNGLLRMISGVLVIVLGLGLCACGKNDVVSVPDASLAKQYMYSYQELEISDAGDEINILSVSQQNDRLYMIAEIYRWDSVDNENEIELISMKPDGTDIQKIEIQFPQTKTDAEDFTVEEVSAEEIPMMDEEWSEEELSAEELSEEELFEDELYYEYTTYSNYVFGKNGKLYAMKEDYIEDYSDPENPIVKQDYYICAWELNGRFLWEKQIENLQEEVGYSAITKVLALEDGGFALLVNGDDIFGVILDAEGNQTDIIQLKNGKVLLENYSEMIEKGDGHLLFTYNSDDNNAMYLTDYDVRTDTVGEEILLPDTIVSSGYVTMEAGKDTDLIYSTSEGIYGYNIGEEPFQMMNFINSDLNTTGMIKTIMLNDTQFVGFYYDSVDYLPRGAVFTKRNPEDIPDKSVIVIGGMFVDYDVRNQIYAFNKSSDKYRIVVKEYESYNTEENYTAGYAQLNKDIISGNMPDILLLDESMPIESYIEKGLIADVDSLIAEDEELSQEEFLDNVFEAFRIDGKLYYVLPSFSARIMMGKTSLLGDKTGWNMQEFMETVNALPEGTQAISGLTREYFTYLLLQYCGNEFVDMASGKCHFDSPEFKSLLEYAKTLPEEIEREENQEEYWMNYQSQFREDKTFLMETYLNTLQDMSYIMNGYFGEDVTFVGFPTEDKNGSVVMKDVSFAVSAKSANRLGAWEFVRYYLTDEYQRTLEWRLPVSKEIFMEKANEALDRPYYWNEDGQKEYYDNYFEINGETIVLEPLSQKQLDQVVSEILSITKCDYYNENIQNIIMEEAAAFYADQKSVEEVVRIIQSRVQIYMDENY